MGIGIARSDATMSRQKNRRGDGGVKELPIGMKQSTQDFVPEAMAGRWNLF